ncbi:MAG: GldG family protein [Defluviitaleaceae bacterium]|nr:GldG family protein [Defluviitaleaceae bacterium]
MKFLQLFKDKRFRYGTMSTAMMIVAIVVFVLVNLVADEFDHSFDLTAEQLYTLTDQSHRFLNELDMEVTLSYVVRTGGESEMITRLLAEYDSASPRITTENRDPMINPTFVHQFAADIEGGVPEGSVIVRTDQGFRVIRPQDMQTWNRDQQTGQWFRASWDAEREITQAIHALTLGAPPVIYHITGSGEMTLPTTFVEYLESDNFIIRTHDAVLGDIPETADALFITLPTRDWSSIKADRILDYLENHEGRAFFALGISPERFPQLDRVLQAYGLRLNNYLVWEGNPQRTLMDDPALMMPMWEMQEEIMLPLFLQGFTGLLVMNTSGIETLDMRRTGTAIEPLFTTTRDAIGLFPGDDDEVLTAPGPFDLAVAVTDQFTAETTLTTRLVVVANWSIMSEDFNMFIGGGNWAFVSASLNWLQDQPPGIWVPVRRPPGAAPVMISDAQVVTMTGVAMGLLPVGLFAIGIFVWFRRRHS